ncbi:hypothetical protein VTJ04DRAFT_10791 [Mycothermus thermophilus]|uniref:uncharacterized protein n=1 Tax=Humicola insolens TaxID=85995 RepID=UPI0037424CC3
MFGVGLVRWIVVSCWQLAYRAWFWRLKGAFGEGSRKLMESLLCLPSYITQSYLELRISLFRGRLQGFKDNDRPAAKQLAIPSLRLSSVVPDIPTRLAKMDEINQWWDNTPDNQKDLVTTKVHTVERESIRRPTPLIDPARFRYGIKVVAVYDRDKDPRRDTVENGQDKDKKRGTIETGGGRKSPTDITTSRGINELQVTQASLKRLRAQWNQDRDQLSGLLSAKLATTETIEIDDDDKQPQATSSTSIGSHPSTGLRKNLRDIRRKLGYENSIESYFGHELAEAKKDPGVYKDQDEILKQPHWQTYLASRSGQDSRTLIRGFPMVEDVVFVKHQNTWSGEEVAGVNLPNGPCYWQSLSLLLYGNVYAWLRVKAEHLSYLERALLDSNHPRHQFYTREGRFVTNTWASGFTKGAREISANLWEMLQVPNCWVNDAMCYLTADVYGNEDHFQPMVPNDFYAWEFKLPPLTLKATAKYKLETKERTGRRAGDGPKHHFRAEFKSLPGVLARPWYTWDHLTMAVGYGPYGPRTREDMPLGNTPGEKGQKRGHEDDQGGRGPKIRKTGNGTTPLTPASTPGTQPTTTPGPQTPQGTSNRGQSNDAIINQLQDLVNGYQAMFEKEKTNHKNTLRQLADEQKLVKGLQDQLQMAQQSQPSQQSQQSQAAALSNCLNQLLQFQNRVTQLELQAQQERQQRQQVQQQLQQLQQQPQQPLRMLHLPLPPNMYYKDVTRAMLNSLTRERLANWAWELRLCGIRDTYTTQNGGMKKVTLVDLLDDGSLQAAHYRDNRTLVSEEDGEDRDVAVIRRRPQQGGGGSGGGAPPPGPPPGPPGSQGPRTGTGGPGGSGSVYQLGVQPGLSGSQGPVTAPHGFYTTGPYPQAPYQPGLPPVQLGLPQRRQPGPLPGPHGSQVPTTAQPGPSGARGPTTSGRIPPDNELGPLELGPLQPFSRVTPPPQPQTQNHPASGGQRSDGGSGTADEPFEIDDD